MALRGPMVCQVRARRRRCLISLSRCYILTLQKRQANQGHIHAPQRTSGWAGVQTQVWGLCNLCVCVCVLGRFIRVQRFVTPMDCSPSGSSVHRILQARRRRGFATPFSRGSSQPGDRTSLTSPGLAGGFFTTSTTWEAP